MHDLQAGSGAHDHEGRDDQRHCRGGREDRRQPVQRPAADEVGADSLALFALEILHAPDQQQCAARGDPQQRQERDRRPERELAAGDQRREHSAHQGQWQGHERQGGQAPAPERGLQQQEDRDHAPDPEREHAGRADLLGGGLGQHLGVVLEREAQLLEPGLDVAGHRADASPAHIGLDVHAPGDRVALDHRRLRHDAHVRDLAEAHVSPARGVDQQVAHAGDALPRLGHPLHHHVEDLLVLEDAADVDALQQRGLSAADVAGLDPVPAGLGQIDLDLQRRLAGGQLEPWIHDAVHLGHDLPDLLGLAAQHGQVLSEDAHDQRSVGSGEDVQAVAANRVVALVQRPDVADLLRRVGDDVALDAAHPAHRTLDRGDRRVVVGPGVDAHPHLAGVDVDDLIAGDGTSDVGADVVDARYRAQVAADRRGDLGHPRVRRPRRGVEADEDVAVLERRDQRRSQERERGEARHDAGGDGDERRSRPAREGRERPVVAGGQAVQERGGGASGTTSREEDQAQRGGDGERDQHRCRHRERVRQRQWLEERSRPPLHDRERDDRQQRDECRVGQRAADLLRRVEDDRRGRYVAAGLALLAHAPGDVLGTRDRVVDHEGERDGQAGEGDRVEGLAEEVEHERRRHQREGDRHERDEDRSPLEQECGEAERHQRAAGDQREREVGGRVLDERRGPEHRRVRAHAGQARPKLVERRLDASRHLERVRARELLDDEQQPVAVTHDRIADQRLVVDRNARHVRQAQPAAGAFDRHLPELVGIGELLEDVADLQPLLRGLDESARAGRRGLQEAEG
jgi:hypothetical protein